MDLFLLELVILLGWPAILAFGSSWLNWHALTRPRIFLTLALVALYGLYAVVMALIPARAGGHFLSMATPGEPRDTVWLPLLTDYAWPLAVFTVLALALVAGLLRLLHKKAR